MDSPIGAKLLIQGARGVVIEGTMIRSCISTSISLSIPRGITVLCKSCFSGQDNLERVKLPSSIVSVEPKCFANCPNLKTIYCYSSLQSFEGILKYGNNAEVVYVDCGKGCKR